MGFALVVDREPIRTNPLAVPLFCVPRLFDVALLVCRLSRLNLHAAQKTINGQRHNSNAWLSHDLATWTIALVEHGDSTTATARVQVL